MEIRAAPRAARDSPPTAVAAVRRLDLPLRMTLPVAPPGFSWTAEPWGPMLRCDALSAVARHGFTSRQLQLRPGELASARWAQAAASVSCSVERVGRVRQVHGAAVRVVHAGDTPQAPIDADAIVTAEPGVAVAVVVADCVPILLTDPVTGAVAAVHAGWRGTAARVVDEAVRTLVREFGVAPDRLVAAVGPSIGACCYEVGEELLAAFTDAGFSSIDRAEWFSRDAAGRLRLDLWRANADQLVHAGLAPDRVHVSGLCTKTHLEVFESFRAEGDQAGRMAAIVVAGGSTPIARTNR